MSMGTISLHDISEIEVGPIQVNGPTRWRRITLKSSSGHEYSIAVHAARGEPQELTVIHLSQEHVFFDRSVSPESKGEAR